VTFEMGQIAKTYEFQLQMVAFSKPFELEG
jgi:hypothetical protein